MEKINLCKVAYEYLFEHIVANDFEPGTLIVEGEIGELLNMSRTPVREAMRRLEVEGLVHKIKDVGIIVNEITYDDITEIFEMRILFELHALGNFVKNVTDDEIKSLEKRLLKLDDSSSEQEYYNIDRDIHNSIIRACSNSRMVSYLKTINAQVEKLRRISGTTPERLGKSLKEHLTIVQAIRDRDYEKAYANLVLHLEEVKKSVIKANRKFKLNKVGK